MSCCGKKKKTSYKSVVISDDCESDVVVSSTESSDVLTEVSSADETRNSLYVEVSESFNMPACGDTADITSPDAGRVNSGTILYNSTVGFLLVTQVMDEDTIRVKNECSDCNIKEAGETVASGLIFSIGVPQCGTLSAGGSPSSTTPFLDSDYVIPADEGTVTVKVTNVFGLSVGDTVSIASFEYELVAILDGTTITIKNKGDGGTPTSSVDKDPNGDGVPDYPVVRIGGQNPCTTTAVAEVERIVGCDGSNQTVGVEGAVVGAGLFWDGNKWIQKVVNDTATCFTLVCCLTLDPDNADTFEYLIEISGVDTDYLEQLLGAVSPNPLRITIGDDAFCLTEIVDETHIKVTPSFDVGEITDYADDSVICIASCCDQCIAGVEILNFATGDEPNDDTASAGTTTVSVAAGVSVITLPAPIGSSGTGSTGDGLTDLSYDNTAPCSCSKRIINYLEYEASMTLPTGVTANIEFRIIKQLPTFNRQNYSAHPLHPNPNLSGLDGSPNLLVGGNPGNYYNLNTVKGFVRLRDVLAAGELGKYVSHIRIVVNNTTGSPANISYAYSIVQTLEASNWKIANVP